MSTGPIRRTALGFTLVELMVTIVIATILISIALPTYQAQVRKSRRTEAKTMALDAAVREERFYATQNHYSNDTRDLGYTSDSGQFPFTAGTYYEIKKIDVQAPSITGTITNGSFAVTIDAAPGSPQANDMDCQTFVVDQTGNRTATGGASNPTVTCWQ